LRGRASRVLQCVSCEVSGCLRTGDEERERTSAVRKVTYIYRLSNAGKVDVLQAREMSERLADGSRGRLRVRMERLRHCDEFFRLDSVQSPRLFVARVVDFLPQVLLTPPSDRFVDQAQCEEGSVTFGVLEARVIRPDERRTGNFEEVVENVERKAVEHDFRGFFSCEERSASTVECFEVAQGTYERGRAGCLMRRRKGEGSKRTRVESVGRVS
jgi:hypothetical protein